MIRRARISVRPNVGRLGRAGVTAAPQDAPTSNHTPAESTAQMEDNNNTTAVEAATTPTTTPITPITTPAINPTPTTISSSANVQRRKRFSVKPKVSAAPNRASARPNHNIQASKPPAKEGPAGPPGSDLDEPTPTPTPAAAAAPHHVHPIAQAHLEGAGAGNNPTAQETPVEPTSSEKHRNLESLPAGPAKEVPPKPPDKAPVPPSLLANEARANSERARTLLAKCSKVGQSLPKNLRLSHLLHDQADLQRIAKAQRLRDLLRQEMGKEKEKVKSKCRVKEYALDPSKMTMRDLVHYLPVSNPMTSSEKAQNPEPASQRAEEDDDEVEDDEEEGGDAMMVPRVKVAEDGSLIIDEESLTIEVKRAKGPNPANDRDAVFERGSTTTYSSFRKKTYTKAWSSEETDMFFLAVSMVGTDFSMICQLFPHRARSEIKNKFKKEERANSWRVDKAFKERRRLDLKFFSKLLEKILEFQKKKKKTPRVPSEKKTNRKPKKKANGRTISKDLSDVEEDPLEEDEEEADVQEDPDLVGGQRDVDDTPRTPVHPSSADTPVESDPSAQKPKNKSRKRSKKVEQAEASVPEEAEATLPEDDSTINEPEDAESVTPASGTVTKAAKPHRARAVKPLLPLRRKKGKAAEPVAVPQDAPATNSQDAPATNSQDAPATNSQGAPVTNSQDAPATVETPASDALSTEQVDEDPSPFTQAKKRKKLEYDDDDDDDDDDNDDNSSQDEEEISPIKLNLKPTRYGRMPKATQHLNYPAKEDAAADSASPYRPPSTSTPRPKRPPSKTRSSKTPARESKKPKLVTLRASPSDCSDDDEEEVEEEEAGRKKPDWVGLEEEEEEEEENRLHGSDPTGDSCAPVFVPASLRSPRPVVSAVEETMEELDILVNVPDVLDLSRDSSHHTPCEHAQNETDSVPFEHSLDLLADVIDFLSPEHMEVSDNEAAHTLLTIGNRSLQSLLAHMEDPSTADYITEGPTVSDPDTANQKEDVEPNCDIPFLPPVTAPSDAPTPAVDSTHQDSRATHDDAATLTEDEPIPDTPGESSSSIRDSLLAALSTEPEPLQRDATEEAAVSAVSSPPSKRGRLPKIKPKPNLLRLSRVARPAQKPMTESPKADGNQTQEAVHKEDASEEALVPVAVEEASSVPPTDCVPQSSSAGGHVPTSGGESPPLVLQWGTPARQEETAGSRQSLEVEPQLETSVNSDSQDESSAKRTLEPGPEAATGSETGTDSAPSHPSVDVPAKGMLPEVTEVVPPCPTVTRRRPCLKVKPKPNLGRRARAAPSVESDPAKASPDGNASSSEAHFTKDTVTQSEPESAYGASHDPKTPRPASPPPAPRTEMGSTLTPTGTGVGREDGKADVADSPGGSQAQVQPTKDHPSDTSKQDDVPVPAASEPQPVVDHGPRSEAGTRPRTDQHAAASSPLQVSPKKTPEPLESETSGCTGSQRSRDDREQETSGPGATGATTPVPQPAQREEESSTADGGPAGGDEADRPPAGSKDSVSDVSSSQTEEEEAIRMKPHCVPTTQRRRFNKVKPKPNLGPQASRVCHAKQLPTQRQGTPSHPDTGSGTPREALPLDSQGGGDAGEEHKRPSRSSSVAAQLNCVVSSATESTLNPSMESTANLKNTSCTISETTAVIPDHFDTTVSSVATLTGEAGGEGTTSGHGASWLVEDPFTALDSGVDEVFPSAAVPTAPPVGQENSKAFRCDQAPEAPPSEPLSLPATETPTPVPQTALPVLPDPVPSDPEEPFFILSLTEIPVFPTVGGVFGVSDPPPYLPGTEAAPEPLSDPVTPATPAGRSSSRSTSLCLHRVPETTEEHHRHHDAGSTLPTQTAHGIENTDDPQDPDPVHLPELPEALVGSVEAEPPSKKRRVLSGTMQRKKPAPSPAAAELPEAVAEPVENQDPPSKKRRGPGACQQGAKVEVQPRSTGTRQTRRSSAGKDWTAEAQSKGSTDPQQPPGSTGLLEAEQGEHTPEEAGDAAASRPIETPPHNTPTLKRKPKGFLSFLSNPPTPGPSGTPGSKVKAPPLAPQVKTSRGAARKPGPSLEGGAKKTPLKDFSVATKCRPASHVRPGPAEPRPSTPGCTAEMAEPHQMDQLSVSMGKEEPTTISQYFLSDIFTEVDE
ncbi:unnamed protein product [Lota lota]